MGKEGNKFNIWAIVGFIVGIFSFAYWLSIAGILLNAFALFQISKTKQKGKVLAIIGLVLSVIFAILVLSGHFSFSL
jgi:uncharacterized membrane protein